MIVVSMLSRSIMPSHPHANTAQTENDSANFSQPRKSRNLTHDIPAVSGLFRVNNLVLDLAFSVEY